MIQTSAAISPGSSGGGLFDERGRLIGITSFKIRGGENLNFALPINYVRGMLGTTQRMTLSDLAARLSQEQARSPIPTAAAAPPSKAKATLPAVPDRPVGLPVPTIQGAYRNRAATAILFVEQDGPHIKLAFVDSKQYAYGTGSLTWNPAANAFKGSGELDTLCGSDKQTWKAPTEQVIHMTTSRWIRVSWTQPISVNCDGPVSQVLSSTWQQAFWHPLVSK